MNASDVRKLVVNQIADRWDETNSHRVNLRSVIDPTTAANHAENIQRRSRGI